MKLWPLFLLLGNGAVSAFDESWLDADDEARALAVNEGELVFLTEPPIKKTHHHYNSLELTPRSLRDGWVALQQCHTHLDAVPRSEILFRSERTRALAVSRYENIREAFVEGASVQLRDVGAHARLCLQAETRALRDLGDGLFELTSGPYMRRFLDGYYPMRVRLEIRYPPGLELVDYLPEAEPGFTPTLEPQRFSIDTWFEGRLEIRLRFARADATAP